MQKFISTAAVLAAVALTASACLKLPQANPAPAANAAPPATPVLAPASSASSSTPPAASNAYEVVAMPGSNNQAAKYFKVNVSSGQTTMVRDNDVNNPVPVPDAPMPAGSYHIYGWSQLPDADGNITWGMMRFETGSGRMWVLNGCGTNSPCTWVEVGAAH